MYSYESDQTRLMLRDILSNWADATGYQIRLG